MNSLLALALLVACQDSDDIAARYPDPVPADRAWEMAAEYYGRIAEVLFNDGQKAAIAWHDRAMARLRDPYRQRLADIGATLNCLDRIIPEAVEKYREQVGIALGGWGPPGTGGRALTNPARADLDAAWVLAFRRDFKAALDCLQLGEGGILGNVAQHRADMESLRGSNDDPESLVKMVSKLTYREKGSCPAAFAVLRRLKDSVTRKPQAAHLKAGAAFLRAIRDEAGAQAWENQLFTLDEFSQEDRASMILVRANQSFERGDFASADEGYRRILKEWPRSKTMGSALYNLGFSLMKQKQYPEARAEFEKLVKADVNDRDPGGSIMEMCRNYRPKAIVHIGESYEAEENGEKALEAYREQGKYPMRSFCGNCSESMALASIARTARILVKLGRDDEAMKLLEPVIFEREGYGGRNTELAFMAVDIAVRKGEADSFEAKAGSAKTSHAKLCLEYLRVLRLRAEGNHAALFDVMRGAGGLWPDTSGWQQIRRSQPVGMEAAACLGDMGDPVFEWLCEKVRTKSDAGLALIAIAHFKTDKARALIQGLPVRPNTNDAWQVRQYENLLAEPARVRRYPPPRIQKQDMGLGLTGVVLALAVLAVFEARRRRKRAV